MSECIAQCFITCMILVGVSRAATDPMPADGMRFVNLPVALRFSVAVEKPKNTGYVIFIGTDKQKVATAFYRNQANVEVYEIES